MRLGNIPQGRARPVAIDRANHRHPLRAVGVKDVPDDPIPAARAQVGVDIGRGAAGRVEKTLKEQVKPQRVWAGDPQAVRHQRGGRRSA